MIGRPILSIVAEVAGETEHGRKEHADEQGTYIAQAMVRNPLNEPLPIALQRLPKQKARMNQRSLAIKLEDRVIHEVGSGRRSRDELPSKMPLHGIVGFMRECDSGGRLRFQKIFQSRV